MKSTEELSDRIDALEARLDQTVLAGQARSHRLDELARSTKSLEIFYREQMDRIESLESEVEEVNRRQAERITSLEARVDRTAVNLRNNAADLSKKVNELQRHTDGRKT